MSHLKLEVKESEKSPKVLMNNYALDSVLGKEKDRIGKSERMVVNRFTMEQKIMHQRYKKMMHQSKLTYARIKSDHQMEKTLRQGAVGGGPHLNTDVGRALAADGQDDMLRRVWTYGAWRKRQVDAAADQTSTRIRAQSAPSGGKRRSKKQDADDPQAKGSSTSLAGLTSPSAESWLTSSSSAASSRVGGGGGAGSERPSTSVSIARPSRGGGGQKRRPVSAAVPQPAVKAEQTRVKLLENTTGGASTIYTLSPRAPCVGGNGAQSDTEETDLLLEDLETVVDTEETDTTAVSYAKDQSESSMSRNPSTPIKPRGQFLDTIMSETTTAVPKRRPKTTQALVATGGGQQTTKPAAGGAQRRPRSFREFVGGVVCREPGGRPNLLDIQKVRVRLADYSSQVAQFGERVAPLKAPSTAITDYYTSRLIEGGASGRSAPRAPRLLTEPSEAELRREMGNVRLACFTMKPLDTDFASRPTTYVDIPSY